MQALIKTLLDIVLIRKGPDALPSSWLLLYAAMFLWFVPLIAATLLIPDYTAYNAMLEFAGQLISLLIYAGIIVAAGRIPRVLQSVTAVVGCGALMSVLVITDVVLLQPFLGANIVAVGLFLIICWSVRVDGHIMSRSLDRDWYVGVLIAMAVFLLQYSFIMAMSPAN